MARRAQRLDHFIERLGGFENVVERLVVSVVEQRSQCL